MTGERWRRIEAELVAWFRDTPRMEIARVSGTGDWEAVIEDPVEVDNILDLNLTELARHLDRELPAEPRAQAPHKAVDTV